ncbi:MAG: undecaprenyl/decaprenyl-phosphate alpha-N-acetylglucosaminyl 1-phosphate transferase [Bacteroidales bacterium]|jgi:UDP-N-acetylmuramyl pentapeptide phosphotransferase/UDP-N-acetylglucosamine-1-phosphate transferase|nr:undecaprenyl/decaprenyl-phosphate alpha-N-acetylglucosaminyl 1-phosphate transferase [Bacteroidales bacterium]
MPEIVITGLPAILLAFVSALFITWYYIPKVIRVVRERHLEDKPGFNKIHKKEVPTLGGIGIFGGFIVGFLVGVNGYMPGLSYFTAAAVFLLFVGIKDDLVYLNPRKKFLGELGSAILVALFTNIHITHFHGFLGITGISVVSSYVVTIILIVLIINAVNLIDGIDGLAASVGVISSLVFGIFFFLSGDYGYTVMAAALLGALLAFLRYNMSEGPMKIFMGDSGSLVIGFTLAVLAIRFNELAASDGAILDLKSAPAISIGILIIPLYDTLRVMILRLRDKKSMFIGDKRHIHHLMLRVGMSHRQATLYISLFNLFIITVAFLLDGIGILLLGLVLLALCLIATQLLMLAVKRREAVEPYIIEVTEVTEVTKVG